ncbi:hypothetical protein [Spongiactinospora sp. 9N601]|uniref:hypothetical protein n=1 Tax=Spongiactinospora sp. 9N601 TaxID=3375149 RepID=UPI00379D6C8A
MIGLWDTIMVTRAFGQAVAYLEIGCGPLVRLRLTPGGRVVFSHAPAVPGSYGVRVEPAPDADHVGTLIVEGRSPGAVPRPGAV